jgi:hypothetical protein
MIIISLRTLKVFYRETRRKLTLPLAHNQQCMTDDYKKMSCSCTFVATKSDTRNQYINVDTCTVFTYLDRLRSLACSHSELILKSWFLQAVGTTLSTGEQPVTRTLPTQDDETKQTQTHIHYSSGIRTHDCRVWEDEDISCHCDRQVSSDKITYLLTELSPSWEAANCAANQELPSILWKPKVHHRFHKSSPLAPILIQIAPVHTIPFL